MEGPGSSIGLGGGLTREPPGASGPGERCSSTRFRQGTLLGLANTRKATVPTSWSRLPTAMMSAP